MFLTVCLPHGWLMVRVAIKAQQYQKPIVCIHAVIRVRPLITDKHLLLVMTLIALCCTRQSQARNIDRCAPEVWFWPWPRPLTLEHGNSDAKTRFFNFGILPWPLTYDPYQWCANPGISNPNPDPNPGTLNPNPAESESTPFFLNPNPNPNPTALNPNPDSNPAGQRMPQEAARRVWLYKGYWLQMWHDSFVLLANEHELRKSNPSNISMLVFQDVKVGFPISFR